MQTDFHHAVTYVVARLGGLPHAESSVVAYAAQYVDDATNSGRVKFDNGALYQRIASAHRMLDYRNFESLANQQVWLPFHFLPGNGGLPAGEDPPGAFIEKLVCRPNSYVAKDLVAASIRARGLAYGLHRFGITLHTFADTWAHQGFAGVSHIVNQASDIVDQDEKPNVPLMDKLKNFFLSEALPLGHGAVLSNPDKPFLVWGYTDGRGRHIKRDNPTDYLEAANEMCRAVRRFVAGDPEADVPGLPSEDEKRIDILLRGLTGDEGERHEAWLAAIADGDFSFGRADVGYVAKGDGSWKHLALDTLEEMDDEDSVYVYRREFLRSDWKLFHDALQSHRFSLIHDIFPRYSICAA